VSTAVTVATAAVVVVVAAPAAITVAVVVAVLTADAACNAVGGGGGAELMGLALSCAKSLWRPAPLSPTKRKLTYIWWRYLIEFGGDI
jgi:hypothetical protein